MQPAVDPVTPLYDTIRLLGVLLLGYTAYRDFEGAIPNTIWALLVGIGTTALLLDVTTTAAATGLPALALLKGGVSILLATSLGFGAWKAGWIGGADSKALISIGFLFPWTPSYLLAVPGTDTVLHFPLVFVESGLFSISTIVINIGLLYLFSPLFVGVYNALTGRFHRHMFSAVPCTPETLLTVDGTPIDPDLQATYCTNAVLREYIQWQNTTLPDLQADPARFKRPSRTDGGHGTNTPPGLQDDWRAVEFVQQTQTSTSNVTPSGVRSALDALTETPRHQYWVRPYLPITPWLFLGTVLGISLGNLIWAARLLL